LILIKNQTYKSAETVWFISQELSS